MSVQCPNHPQAKMKKLAKPPSTASRRVGLDGRRDCDFFTYYRCPVCKVDYAEQKDTPKPDLIVCRRRSRQ